MREPDATSARSNASTLLYFYRIQVGYATFAVYTSEEKNKEGRDIYEKK